MTNFISDFDERIAKLEGTVAEVAKKYDDDLAATRTRLEKEVQLRVAVERSKLVLSVVEVLDELERAVGHGDGGNLLEGIWVIIDLFRARLAALGVARIDLHGTKYDPETAHAIAVEPGEEGIVTQVILSGYKLGDQLLRAGKVIVGDGQTAALVRRGGKGKDNGNETADVR